ncbi:MAG: rhodanese-like domain-containing protein [Acidiferrobacterales bacterium]|nr:rhodanese-like domain-containing protein [Acidiferrobacterales bacterium]
MNTWWRGPIILLATTLLIACSEQESTIEPETDPVGSINVESSIDAQDHSTPEFIPDYISAVDLNARFEQQSEPFIFDVRSKGSFEKSHIQSALWVPYGNTEESDLMKIVNLNKDSEIVTYCGCPRHLSSLQAKFLKDLGYNNVKVLYDGLWVWQENGFPTLYAETTQTTMLKFSGELISSDHSVNRTDVFLRHVKSGQLEAARSTADGTFSFDFHIYDYRPDDEFELMLTQLDSPAIKTIAPTESEVSAEIHLEIFL